MSGDVCVSAGRDPALAAVIAAKGLRTLARAVGVRPQSLGGWRRVPRERLFAVARAAGVEPETLRPDLAGWIEGERERGWMERARARFGISTGMAGGTATLKAASRPDPGTMDLLDLGLVAAALRFAAAERGLHVRAVIGAAMGGAGGTPTPEQSARSYGMALAVVVGRVRAETVSAFVGVSRQAVDNATERYLRQRDGDDPELLEDGRALERGRLRAAKAPDEAVQEAERRFVRSLAGEAA